MRKLRVGVIGTGKFAEVCHVPGIKSHPQAEVVALCGRRYDHARALADWLHIRDVHTDHHELCERQDIDAVTIATPNVEHAEQAITGFACGKHVFCEKPLAINVAESRQLVRAAEVSGRIHQVAFTYRYLYGVQELRRRLLQGDLGTPYYLRIQHECWQGMEPDYKVGFRDKLNLAGGGMLYDMGSHMFDLARFVLGPIDVVTGFTQLIPRQRIDCRTGQPADVETDDIAGAWFIHENGVRGQWLASRATPSSGDKGYLEVIGPEGALKASLSRGTVDVLKASSPTRPSWEELQLPAEARDGKPHCLNIMMRGFVDACLRGKLDDDVDASFHDGLAAQQGLAAVIEADEKGHWVHLKKAF